MASVIPARWPAAAPVRRGNVGMLLGSVSVHAMAFAAIVLAPWLAPAPDLSPPTTIDMVMAEAAPAEEPAKADVAPLAAAEPPPPEPPAPEPPAPEPPAEPAILPPEPPPPEPPPPEPPSPEPSPEPPPPTETSAEPLVEPPPPPLPPRVIPPPEPPRPAPPRPKPRPVAAPARSAEPGPSATPVAAPAPAEPAPAPPRVSASWNAAIAAWIHRHKSYPQAARALGQQGSGHVRFTVARDGSVLDVHLTRGTGSSILDEAMRTLLTGAHLPAFPADMPHERVTVQVQISYSLDR